MVLCFSEFTLIYFPQKPFKGQALADFLANHPSVKIRIEQSVELGIYGAEKEPWILKFDGSSIENSTGAGIVIISPRGVKNTLSFNLAFECTNNQVEYKALMIGLEILLALRPKDVRVIGDSKLVLWKLTWEYKCNNLLLAPYFTAPIQLLASFDNVKFEHVPRESNWEVDELAQIAYGVKMGEELTYKLIMIEKKNHPSIFERGIDLDIFNNDVNISRDWRIEFKEYLENPNKRVPHRTKVQAQHFVLLEGELYKKGFDKLLLKRLSFPDSMEVMKKVHEGVCGAY